jgi:hypothetical protein
LIVSYTYVPIYGVEPYDAMNVPVAQEFGGGADITNDNLLITLWGVDLVDLAIPLTGELLKPYPNTQAGANDAAAAAAGGLNNYLEGFSQFYNSRYSSRFIFSRNEEFQHDQLLGVMQPPQDLKNQLALAVKTNNNSVSFQASVLSLPAWHYYVTNLFNGAISGFAFFGGGSPSIFGTIPFLKTSGANGVFPVAFDTSTIAGLKAMFDAVILGNFYVPVLIGTSENIDLAHDLAWGHSPGRR